MQNRRIPFDRRSFCSIYVRRAIADPRIPWSSTHYVYSVAPGSSMEEPDGVAETPVGHVHFLQFFRYNKRTFLQHSLTSEIVQVPEEFGAAPRLCFNNEGWAFIAGGVNAEGASCKWVHLMLHLHLVRRQDGVLMIKRQDFHSQLSVSPLPEQVFMKGLSFGTLGVDVGPTHRSEVFDVIATTFRFNGCLLWWSLPKLYDIIGSRASRPWGSFRAKMWKAWKIFINTLSLHATALILGAPQKSTLEEAADTYFCPAAWAAASTHAVIALLVRFSGPHPASGRVDKLEQGAEQLLAGMMAYLPHHFQLALCARDGTWSPPFCVHGQNMLYLEVNGCEVDLSPIIASSAEISGQFLGLGTRKRCSVVELLQASPCIQKPHGTVGFMDQLIWQVGSFMEAALLGVRLEDLGTVNWKAESVLAGRGPWNRHHRDCFLKAYTLRTQPLLDAQEVVDVAADDARIGRSSWKIIAVGFPCAKVAAWLAPQTHHDYESVADILEEEGDLNGAKLERERVHERCEDLMHNMDRKRLKLTDDKRGSFAKIKAAKGHRFYRAKSYHLMLELDNALQGPEKKGDGMLRFQLKKDWQSSMDGCLDWPILLIHSDQGSDFWCAMNWLDYSPEARIPVIRKPDVNNHGVHNDLIGAGVDVGQGPFLYAMLVPANLRFLPFKDGKYGKMLTQLRDSLKRDEAAGHLPEQMTVEFLSYFETIVLEKGLSGEAYTGQEGEAKVWNAFLDSEYFDLNGRKVGMCRWGQIFEKLGSLLRDWTSLLILIIRLCADEKFMEEALCVRLLRGAGDLPGMGTPGATTRQSSAEEIKELRKACRNAFNFVLKILLDGMNKRRAQVLHYVSRPCWQAFSKQAVELKNFESAGDWMLAHIKGDLWQPIRDTFKTLQGQANLARLGFADGSSTDASKSEKAATL
jgi:hypothetical protein